METVTIRISVDAHTALVKATTMKETFSQTILRLCAEPNPKDPRRTP